MGKKQDRVLGVRAEQWHGVKDWALLVGAHWTTDTFNTLTCTLLHGLEVFLKASLQCMSNRWAEDSISVWVIAVWESSVWLVSPQGFLCLPHCDVRWIRTWQVFVRHGFQPLQVGFSGQSASSISTGISCIYMGPPWVMWETSVLRFCMRCKPRIDKQLFTDIKRGGLLCTGILCSVFSPEADLEKQFLLSVCKTDISLLKMSVRLHAHHYK